jgi:hypothetical protein
MTDVSRGTAAAGSTVAPRTALERGTNIIVIERKIIAAARQVTRMRCFKTLLAVLNMVWFSSEVSEFLEGFAIKGMY